MASILDFRTLEVVDSDMCHSCKSASPWQPPLLDIDGTMTKVVLLRLCPAMEMRESY